MNCCKNPCRKSPYFINLTRSYTSNFIRNSLPHKHDKHIFVLILVALLVATPGERCDRKL